jgi:hypothetical protein
MTEAVARNSLVPGWFVAHRRPVVWLVIAMLAALTAFALALGFAASPGAQPFEPQNPVVFIGSAVVIAAYGFVFALLVVRVGENIVGWIFGTFAIVVAISNAAWAYLTYATEIVPPQLPNVEVVVLAGAALLPTWTFLVVALVVVFPDGRPVSRAWGGYIVATGILAAAVSMSFALSAGPLPLWGIPSPLALSGWAGELFATAGLTLEIVLLLVSLPAVWSLIVRYRAAGDVGRLQLKWLVYAGSVFVATGLTFWILAGSTYEPGSGGSTAMWLLLCFGAGVVPLAASVAILRYHLYDIETIIGRTLVYGGLTAILAGIYTAAIRLFNWLFVEMTGEDSDAALVLTTLVLATTFTPIKSWLEARVAERKSVIVDPDEVATTPMPPDLDEAALQRLADLVSERLARTSEGRAPSRPGSP